MHIVEHNHTKMFLTTNQGMKCPDKISNLMLASTHILSNVISFF